MRRWVARWRVALRIARRDAGRHRLRTVLVVAMVALPLLAGTAMVTLIRSTVVTPQNQVAAELGPAAQARVVAGPCRPYDQNPRGPAGSCDGDGSDVREIDAAALRSVLGVEQVLTLHHASVTLAGDAAAVPDQEVSEVDAAAAGELDQAVEAVAGTLPRQAGEIALATGLARRLGVDVGDVVRLESGDDRLDATVVGLLHPRTVYRAVTVVGTAPQTDEQRSPTWLVLGHESVIWEQVLAGNEQGWDVLSRAVAADPPALADTPYGQRIGPDTAGTMRSAGLVGAVLAMGLLEIVLLVGPAFAIGARRSGRQLAVVAAAGGAPADLRRVVLGSGLIVGLTSAVLGIGLGLGLTGIGTLVVNAVVTDGYLDLVLPTWELPAMAGVAIVLGLAAAWLPARSASRSDVVASLAGRRAEPRSVRGLGWLGLAVAVLGALTMLLGAVTARSELLIAGVLVLEVGVVVATGALVGALAGLAPRLGVASRFALRDAARHRSRTAPAVAAVLAAVAAASAGGIYLEGQQTADRESWRYLTESPALVLTWGGDDLGEPGDAVARALERLRDEEGVQEAVPVAVALPADVADPTMLDVQDTWIWGDMDPSLDCDVGALPDPRCDPGPGVGTSRSWIGTLVDDGTVIGLTDLEGSREAAGVLARGGAVIDASALWPDGTAHLVRGGPEVDEVTAVVPAHGTTWFVAAYSTVLSPESADALGLGSVVVGGLITTTTELDQEDVDRLNALVREVSTGLTLSADRPRAEGPSIALVLVGVATLVALIAVGLAVGLAGADTRPDMATLAAVGAPPRVRRRIAAAQAGVIAGIGGVLGTLTGIPIGLVLSLWGRESSGYGDLWPLAVPWQTTLLAVVVPLVAMAAAWLLTRSRLPLVHRVEG